MSKFSVKDRIVFNNEQIQGTVDVDNGNGTYGVSFEMKAGCGSVVLREEEMVLISSPPKSYC